MAGRSDVAALDNSGAEVAWEASRGVVAGRAAAEMLAPRKVRVVIQAWMTPQCTALDGLRQVDGWVLEGAL